MKYRVLKTNSSGSELALRLRMMQGPEMTRSIEELYARYGKDAVPAIELRRMLDKEMKQKTLTGELYAIREGGLL